MINAYETNKRNIDLNEELEEEKNKIKILTEKVNQLEINLKVEKIKIFKKIGKIICMTKGQF